MKTEITPERQEHIVNYLMTNLSKKGVKMSHFAEMCGIDQVSLSKTKKEGTRHQVSAPAWEHLNGIYEAKSFDDVMRGAIIKFQPKQISKKEKIPTLKKEVKPVESNYDKHIREERERFEALKIKKEPEPRPLRDDELCLEEKEEIKNLESMKIKRLSENPELVNKIEPVKSFNTLQDITVGMAIDALIKAGAKVSVSLEV